MTCNEVSALFSDYYDGIAENAPDIESHMSACSDCRAAYADYAALFDELHAWPPPEPPADLRVKMLAAALTRQARPYRLWGAVGGAVAAGFVALSLAVSGLSALVTRPPLPVADSTATQAEAYDGGAAAAYDVAEADDAAGTADGAMADAGAIVEMEMAVAMQASSTESAALPAPVMAAAPAEAVLPTETYAERQCYIELRVDSLPSAARVINGLPGYSLQAHTQYADAGGNGTFHRRVSAADFDAAREALRALGFVASENETVVSHTYEVRDLTARLAAKDEEVARLLALLGESRTMEVLTAVERSLGAAENDRDYLRGRLNQLTALSAQPLITVGLYENPPPAVQLPEEPFAARVSQRFIHSLNATVRAAEYIAVGLAGAVVPLVLGALAGCAVWHLRTWFIRKRRKGRE